VALDSAHDGSAARTLKAMAAVVVVAAGLKVAAPVLLPIVAAGFIALVVLPTQERLIGWGLPKSVAIGLTLLVALLGLGAFTSVLTTSLAEFGQDLPRLREQLRGAATDVASWLAGHGWEGPSATVSQRLDPNVLLDLVTGAASGILDLLSSFVVILLLTIFALVEADDLPAKLRLALANPGADLALYARIARGVSTYAFWKTASNALTGSLVALACWAMGLANPLLWGLVAFVFNYVPSVGALLVAAPIVLVTVVEQGVARGALMGVVQLGIGQLVGSVLEPLVMGRQLGLSPLVVLLSLLLWGWLWGPVGMLLSVPLTMVVRLLLLESRDGRALAILMGPRPPPDAPALKAG
jgi:predicted PurR-regulated permease PerM